MASSDFEDLKAPLFRLFGKVAAPRNGDAGALTFLMQPLWREAVGPLASRTELKTFAAGLLRVEVDPAFLGDLRRAEAMVLSRLNARLDARYAVRRIELLPAPSGAPDARLAYVRSPRTQVPRPQG
ncbi:MAG: hypothetical protein LBM75_01125 [Myxococcales bacterium]|jgi:hypothetical protein|nr:hypothetical protein [Myxococcales bacterium]